MDIERQIEIILRGVSEIISVDELKQKLQRKKQLVVKLGVDPTAPDIHLGHTVILRKLRQFQDLGHKVVFIIGDFTARIGDPSGRDTTRPILSEEEILANAKTYTEQVFKILDKDKTEVVYNSQWLYPLGIDGLLQLCSKYTVARMLERDDFEQRYRNKNPITILEFIYPLLQGYDSVVTKADVELGGNDQKFNLIVGRELQKDAGIEPQVIITMPLLEGTDGVRKMSKSYNNYIALNDTAKDMFGKIMSIPDNIMLKYFELLTDENMGKIEQMVKENPRDAKSYLGYLVVRQYYGEETASNVQKEFDKVFSKKELPSEIPVVVVKKKKYELIDLLTEYQLTSSKSEAKRLLSQGGIKIDSQKVTQNIILDFVENPKEILLQIGKLKFIKLQPG
ncbi:MAG: tyrosine--tRNA ligase [Elusimicrobiota bacterium]|nr:tyrosine--tRNA ligase [Elusimicrobiota bacterium]